MHADAQLVEGKGPNVNLKVFKLAGTVNHLVCLNDIPDCW